MRVNLDEFHLKDIKNPIHPSIFMQEKEYDILIIRLPYEKRTFQNESYAFVMTNESYYLYNKSNHEFKDLVDIKGFYELLNEKIDIAMNMTYEMYDKIEDIEDELYENKHINGFNHKWFFYKNSLIKINRVIEKAIEAMKSFIKNYKIEEDFLEINFSDLLEHLERTGRTAAHALEKLDALYNFHASYSNERMNKTIYVLTLLSGIFLPLNFLVGFFGMNTTTLPFTQEEGGTYFVISILASVLFVCLLVIIYLNRVKKIKE
ncbi:MAG: CorA family divalent cation transporter [Arcobacteraceae bacterium]